MKVLIAGGSGFIGRKLSKFLGEKGHEVKILSRSKKGPDSVYWNPKRKEIDREQLKETEVIINLSGAGIADKRWTSSRRKELIDSRTEPILFLFEERENFPNLKQFITASGVTCYGFEERERAYKEEDEFGTDFLATIVKEWENAADVFNDFMPVTKLRISVVLADSGGAMEKMVKPIRNGMGAALASGQQIMPCVHIDDLCHMFEHVMMGELDGAYNAVGANATNEHLTQLIAKQLGKKIRLPNVPSFVLKLMFGSMAEMLIEGVPVSNDKIMDSGFTFQYDTIEQMVNSLDLRGSSS